MRDALLKRRGKSSLSPQPWRFETGIINLDDSIGAGTHWVAYVKKDQFCEYFDSYGNLRPPQEFYKYMLNDAGGGDVNISYNYNNIQKDEKFNCGHLCLRFLSNACNDMFSK